jgi:hypothetical protein
LLQGRINCKLFLEIQLTALHLESLKIKRKGVSKYIYVFISAVFLFLSNGGLNAQNELIELKSSLIRLPNQSYYLETVVDGRGNQNDIGFIMKGAFNKKVKADLKGGVAPTLNQFYQYALNRDTLKTPIVMRIVFLYISEKTNGASESGKAEMKVEFYKREGNQLAKVFETEAISEEDGVDVTSGHERRIRKVLENVILSFNNSDWQSAELNFVPAENILARQSQILANTLTPEDYNWISLLMANAAFGTNAEGWGGSYMGFSTRQRRGWMIPVHVAIDRITVDPSLFNRAGYDEKNNIRFSYFKLGSGGIKKLGEDFNFVFGINAVGGSEELLRINNDETTTTSTSIVFGGEASQSFYFISRSRFGFFLGAGIYERILSSDVYKNDIGLRIEAGFKF